jgi:hypothetical protein
VDHAHAAFADGVADDDLAPLEIELAALAEAPDRLPMGLWPSALGAEPSAVLEHVFA